jgi:hypothetical protein
MPTYHPANLPGEMAGKSSNLAWATRTVGEPVGPDEMYHYDITVLDSVNSVDFFDRIGAQV